MTLHSIQFVRKVRYPGPCVLQINGGCPDYYALPYTAGGLLWPFSVSSHNLACHIECSYEARSHRQQLTAPLPGRPYIRHAIGDKRPQAHPAVVEPAVHFRRRLLSDLSFLSALVPGGHSVLCSLSQPVRFVITFVDQLCKARRGFAALLS